MVIVGVSGSAGSGKDAVGALLSMRRFVRIAFGDALREEVASAIRYGSFPVSTPPSIVDYMKRYRKSLKDIYAKPTPLGVRKILQWWGTDYRRSQDPDYWVIKLAESLYGQHESSSWVIPDVRFQNEIDFIRSKDNGIVIRLEGRSSSRVPVHSSEEQTLTGFYEHIKNTGTLYDLAFKVRSVLISRGIHEHSTASQS